ncbi:type VI secretion system-associated protein TagF [Methylobacterium sp. NEAU 140]|uniref:type VI secretion system-associated protein TagF n=1 Tax=Methylobacterium sp. NEAU 140 TaxID=3064945 RepID=UPI0027332061|nr:type VI secretion system-associated protein TagF [Methylobacterium sp. NEAU 140]MDP4024937.1 type VI secretion system-associated protein TagF [Methylobacterium sp. NEAU 140]
MPCGLYGKLPAKRDFIAVGVARGFLSAWEPWIQAGLAASRLNLGPGWTDAFLRAPIWRFWLGAEVAGEPVLGSLMPSVDGVGRYFPLTLVYRSDRSEGLPPPEIEPGDAWFAQAEAFLLATLSATDFDRVLAALSDLPEMPAAPPRMPVGAARLRGGTLVGPAEDGDVGAALARLRPSAHAGLHAGMSYWWTPGGEDFPARAACCRGLPDPTVFSGLLTGRFDARDH